MMKSIRFAVLAMACSSVALTATAGDWVSLFNGDDLTGWEQLNGTADYKVEKGAIVGTTVKGSPNSFLCSTRDYGNFELTCEVKVDDALNSGVQIRSRIKGEEAGVKPPANTKREGRYYGPQVEIESSPGQAGYVYGEAMGTGWLSPEPDSKGPKASHSVLKNGEWNTYRIVAKGPRIQTYINGELIADLTHEATYASHPTGSIGLQVHSIPGDKGPYQVRWMNLRIKEL